ncbi:unnamed protein product [Calypogeia fissa]
MATFDGAAAEVRIGAPGPWAQRRIPFYATSTYSSAPAMQPLNEPIANGATGAGGANGVAGGLASHHNPGQQQQYHHNQHANGGSKPGHSEPPSLPSSMPLQWPAPQKIGAGLSNLGNTCFLNSVLQCLTYTPPLAGYLQSGLHKASCRVAGFCAFCALQEHVQQALASSGKVVSPQKMAKNLRSICRTFRMGRQEDSHEYMRYLLEALHKCCLPPELAKNSNSKSSQEKSLVYRIFGGQLRSQVKCTACDHCSNTYDPFLDLSLEIVRADSLTKALARFTAVDVLDGDNKYKCPRCKKKVRALKNFTIDLVPNILTIQFKRFSNTGGQGGKIDKKVEFGTTLDLKPFVSNGQDYVPKYKLFGVLVHSGWSTHSGHYYSFLRASSDIWHVFDDSRVRQVSEKTVLEQKAYMLFYVREGKRMASSQPGPTPSKQAMPRQVALLSKERQINSDSGVAARPATSQPTSTISKESERKPLAEVLPKKEFSGSVNVVSKEREGSGQVRVIVKQAPLQPVVVAPEDTQQSSVQPSEGNALRVDAPTMNGSAPEVAVAVAVAVAEPSPLPPVPNHGSSDTTTVHPTPPVSRELCVSNENIEKTEMEIDNSCTTSGNPGCEDDWDEYYKKGWNPPGNGTAPQKFLKMLRVIPHTRRYYQARALPARRPSKIAGNGNVELENGHPETSDALTSGGAKRPQSFSEDARGQKRQYKESGRSIISSTCMASEEFLAVNEPMDVDSSNGTGPPLQENRLESKIETANMENGSLRDNFAVNNVGDGQGVAKRPLVAAVDNGQSASNGHVEVSHGHSTESLKPREVQQSGVELRVDRDVENCRSSEGGDGGSQRKTSTNGPLSENCPETSKETAVPMAANSLYGISVPRWGESNGDEHSVKEIERLLEQEKKGSFERDIWDVEYDKGRSKKVKNRTGKEPANNESNGLANGFTKPSNPFQSVGFAKKMGNSIKKGNSIGFKAGYGYGLKTGKNVGSAGPQTT